jgi:pSer/pThr/pTyr-binding forkhead associated (FHA) protein
VAAQDGIIFGSGTPDAASTGDVHTEDSRARHKGAGTLRSQNRSQEATWVLAPIWLKVSQFMSVRLAVKEGPHQGREFEFEEHDSFIVGRSARAQFQLPLKDTSLSRVHFMVEVSPPHCRLTDLGSTNGTRVNGRKISAVDLVDGDVIAAGKTVLIFSMTGAEATTIPATALEGSRSDANVKAASVPLASTIDHIPVTTEPAGDRSGAGRSSSTSALSTMIPSNDPSALRRRGEATTTSCSACGARLSAAATASSSTTAERTRVLCPACLAQARDLAQP